MIPHTKPKAFVKFTEFVDSERALSCVLEDRYTPVNPIKTMLEQFYSHVDDSRRRRQMSYETNRPHTKLSLNNNYELIPQKIND